MRAFADCPLLAEAELLKVQEAKPNFALLLLQIVSLDSFPLNTRLSSALCFKNYIRFNYVVRSVQTIVIILLLLTSRAG